MTYSIKYIFIYLLLLKKKNQMAEFSYTFKMIIVGDVGINNFLNPVIKMKK
jgi:hypothetical protein